MTNYEWLLQMDGAARKSWFDTEHVEGENGTLDGDTAALNAKIAELERKLRISWEYECKFQDERDVLQEQVDELTAERDELEVRADYNSHGWAKANIGWAEANAETEKWRMKCEEYRNKFGKCIDYADAIHALMDDRGLA